METSFRNYLKDKPIQIKDMPKRNNDQMNSFSTKPEKQQPNRFFISSKRH